MYLGNSIWLQTFVHSNLCWRHYWFGSCGVTMNWKVGFESVYGSVLYFSFFATCPQLSRCYRSNPSTKRWRYRSPISSNCWYRLSIFDGLCLQRLYNAWGYLMPYSIEMAKLVENLQLLFSLVIMSFWIIILFLELGVSLLQLVLVEILMYEVLIMINKLCWVHPSLSRFALYKLHSVCPVRFDSLLIMIEKTKALR